MQPPRSVDRRLHTAAVGGALAVALAGAIVAVAFDGGQSTYRIQEIVAAAVIGVYGVVGAVVALSTPGNLIGWLLVGGAAVAGAGEAMTEAGVHGQLIAPGSVPGSAYLVTFGVTLRALSSVITIAALPAFFPDGQLPGRHWAWLRRVIVAAAVFMIVGGVVAPIDTRLAENWRGPLAPAGELGRQLQLLQAVGALLTVVGGVGAIAGLVSRWRQRGPIVRQQLLLFASGVVVAAIFLTAAIGWILATSTGSLPRWTFAAVQLPLPIAIAIATLNHGLYDLRRAANRTILWLLMSASIVATYVVVVLAVAGLTPDRHAWWPPAVAAIAASLALVPLRERLQRLVNRLVYGRWREPYELLSDLAERLAAAADVDRLLDAAVAELATQLDLGDMSVRDLDGVVMAGSSTLAAISIPLEVYGTTVGSLSYSQPNRELSASEQRLINDLAHHLGSTVHARALLNDLRRTRERLVLAREEERRRLRRDLHDGIGPALAGLTLKAETAQAMLPPDATDSWRQLHDLSDEIRATVVDVRRVVEGLRPPALDELGLLGACTQAVDRLTSAARVVCTVDAADPLPPLPAAVEVAAFRIVLEAVTNVVRHSETRRCSVRFALDGPDLVVTIVDDGIGLGDRSHDGNGLATMQERAEELGGSLSLDDEQPGVRVTAHLPAWAANRPGTTTGTEHAQATERAQPTRTVSA